MEGCKQSINTCGQNDNEFCDIALVCLQNEGYLPTNITDFTKDENEESRSYDDSTVIRVIKEKDNFTYEVKTG